MEQNSIFSTDLPIRFFLKILILLTINPINIFGQPVCPYVGGPTLCQLYGQSPIQISILTPTSTNTWLNPNWNAKTVFINATLTVNSLFIVNDCFIKFGPSGKIIVTGDGNFQSTGTKYYSCGSTGWPGIRTEGGSTTLIQNTIEDADVAITIASSSASLNITGNTFNRNRVDILVPGHIVANAVIVGNTFDATSPNYLNAQPEAGIMANNSFITVGLPQPTSILDRNIIKNHQRGASGSVATMNFKFATFECNTQFGIFSENGSIDVRGNQNYRNLFKTNGIDVQSSGTNLYFSDSDFENCLGNNVNSVSNFSAQRITFEGLNIFRIDNNLLGADDKIGINLERSRGGAVDQVNNKILSNSFYIDQFTPEHSRSAIKVVGGPGTPDIMKIWTNFVTVQPGGSSPDTSSSSASPMYNIQVGSADNFSIWLNNISTTNFDLPNYGRRWGFYIHDRVAPSNGHTLIENHVYGNLSNYDHGMGAFHFEESGPWLICENTSDYTLRGFHMSADCSISKFIHNTLGHHQRSQFPGTTETTSALMLEAGTKLGWQICNHNIWQVTSYGPDAGAWHKGNLGIPDNRFDINPNIGEEEPNPIIANDNWFFPICDQEPPSGHVCSGQEPEPEYIADFENAIIEENQIFTQPASVLQWEERKNILAKLIHYLSLRPGGSLANNFYSEHINTSAGQFAQFDDLLNGSFLINPTQLSNLNSYRDQLSNAIFKLDSLDSSIPGISGAKQLSSFFFYYRSTLLIPIGQLLIQLESIESQINASLLAALNQCSQVLTSLPQDNRYEWNQAFINGLMIKKGKGLELSENDILTLRIIARECPEEAGNTRNQAMNLLPTGDPAIHRLDVSYFPGCQHVNGESEDRIYNPKSINSGIHVFPNPASDDLNIVFDFPFSGHLELLDLNGSNKTSFSLNSVNNFNASIDKLPAGLYILVLRTSSGERSTFKFAVSR